MPVVDTVREECPPARVDSRAQRAEQGHGLRTQEACTFWKGRTALYAVLRSLEVSQGDTVLVPGYTCFAVPSAVMFTGARPVFADIDPNTFNVSLQTILKALAETWSRTVKAVVVQHTYGIPADIRPILDWARESGVAVVEDCAHSWGSRYRDNGKWSELGSFGDAAIFSSQWTKPISTGLGGWAIANSPILRERLRHFRSLECIAPSIGESAMLAIQVLARELASSPAAYWTAKRVYQFLYRRGLLLGTSSPEEFRAEMPKGYAKRMSRFQEW